MQIIRFSMIGILNTLLDFGILNFLMIFFDVTTGLPLVLCNSAAFIVANLNGYLFNRGWTFGQKMPGSARGYLAYLLFSAGGLAVSSLVIYGMTSAAILPSGVPAIWNANFAKACATLAGMTWNFLAYRYIVFKGTPEMPSGG